MPIFWGSNNLIPKSSKLDFIPILSPQSNWREELLYQLNIIKQKYKITHVLLFLDDFITIELTDFKIIDNYIRLAIDKKIKYLRLKRIEWSYIGYLFEKKRNKIHVEDSYIYQIDQNHPFYSSLQVAIWDIEYLLDLVLKTNDIWNFENQRSDYIHYTVSKTLINYCHIVEKGKWDYNAKKICNKHIGYFEEGDRPSLNSKIGFLNQLLRKLLFNITGYSYMLFRKRMFNKNKPIF